MARLAIAGVIVALTLAPGVAMAQMDSRAGAPPMPHVGQMPPMGQPMNELGQPMNEMRRPMNDMRQPGPGSDRWGSVPGGWNAYRPPAYGYTLPRYWIAAPHYINDYRGFGLPTPAFGYGWSRYYDDMVLTDRWGRVYDWRAQNDWGRDSRDGGGDYRPRKRDRSGIVGAIIGGAVGALTGNLIAGAGSRLAGSLIGGGVGALAGQAIDRSSHGRDHGGGHGNDGYGYRAQGPHWFMGDYQGGNYGYGCNCGGQSVTTTTTTYAQPIVTKRVHYVTEYVRVPAKRYVTRTKYVRLGKNIPLD